MKMKLYRNMHDAEARARFLELSRPELGHDAPKTVFLHSKTMIVYLPQKLLITGLKAAPKMPQGVGNELSRT